MEHPNRRSLRLWSYLSFFCFVLGFFFQNFCGVRVPGFYSKSSVYERVPPLFSLVLYCFVLFFVFFLAHFVASLPGLYRVFLSSAIELWRLIFVHFLIFENRSRTVSMCFTGFSWFHCFYCLLAYTRFSWVVVGFIGFYWVLLGFLWFCWVIGLVRIGLWLCFNMLSWVLQGFVVFFLGFSGFYWVLLIITMSYKVFVDFIRF